MEYTFQCKAPHVNTYELTSLEELDIYPLLQCHIMWIIWQYSWNFAFPQLKLTPHTLTMNAFMQWMLKYLCLLDTFYAISLPKILFTSKNNAYRFTVHKLTKSLTGKWTRSRHHIHIPPLCGSIYVTLLIVHLKLLWTNTLTSKLNNYSYAIYVIHSNVLMTIKIW